MKSMHRTCRPTGRLPSEPPELTIAKIDIRVVIAHPTASSVRASAIDDDHDDQTNSRNDPAVL